MALSDELSGQLALPVMVFWILGALLVGYGAALAAISVRPQGHWAVLATALDVGWVVGSGVLLVLHDVPNPTIVLAVAAVVLLFAVLQAAGLERPSAPARHPAAAT